MAANPPAINPPNHQQAGTALLGQIPFGAVIGAPLVAAVEAQSTAAIACADFIKKVGFDADGKVKNVTFTFESSEAGNARQLSLTVPLLTIMPLPFIRIESMTVNFKASILAVDERSDAERRSTDLASAAEGSVGFALWKAGVKASVSSKKDSTASSSSKYSVEHTMDIALHAVQDDLPAGLARLLNILTESICVKSA